MNHRKWSAYIWSTMSYNDLMSEHNTLYADWKKSSLEAEHLAKVNGDLCDKIAELKSRPVLTWDECEKEWMRLRGSMEDGVPIQNRKFLAWLQSRLPAPIRVPFSDAVIEKMAEAHMGVLNPFANWEHTDKQYRMNAIRAALAAGGVERASDEELLDIYEAADRDSDAIIAVRARVEAPLLVEIADMKIHCDGRDAQVKHLESAIAKLHANASGLEDMVQRGNERWARVVGERESLRAQLEDVTAERDAANERAEQAEAEAADLRCESSLIGELRTILGLGWGESITERCRELAALRAELRAVTAECKHLNAVIMDMGPVDATPTDAQVEVLARVLQRAYMKECYVDANECTPNAGYLAEARAAYAHIGAQSCSNAEMQICINRKNRRIDALKAIAKKWKAKAAVSTIASAETLDQLAEIAKKAYKLRPNAPEGQRETWPEVVTAILRAAKSRLAVLPYEMYKAYQPNPKSQTWFDFATEYCEARIVYGVEVPPVESRAALVEAIREEIYAAEFGGSPAPIHTGPTRAEAKAKWDECAAAWELGWFRDWLLPQLPETAPSPALACQECAKMKEQRKAFRKIVLDGAEEVRNRIDAARAALEGE